MWTWLLGNKVGTDYWVRKEDGIIEKGGVDFTLSIKACGLDYWVRRMDLIIEYCIRQCGLDYWLRRTI